ncbi:L-alanine-DL-glutamate epimerase [Jatrophihabitans endophyticus]|uniref:L-alanine-DL-glutamate epimerase n=1 Tax=Jatrophihabitans endophyticus TaxID=1206085 RepID=A0A1M5PZQ2_9ACTN|nr:enolase C-terminal domain-like protein [Jatrophihabitans endophyticus]SHH07170.1 L-alanine-DL-glutamate epimerase [Jatrophihabitans endophyticus]
MIIKDVRLVSYRAELPAGYEAPTLYGGQSIAPYVTDFLAVQLVTDEGITGEVVSAYGGLSLAHSIADRLRPILVGRDPAYREAIWQDMWRLDRLNYTTQFAIGTVDVALWDLYAKSLDEPLYKLLGAVRDKVPVYASSMEHPTVQQFVDEALHYKEIGYQGYKLHVWGDARRDIGLVAAVRDAVGPDYPLMIDVAGNYQQHEALKVGRVLEELDYLWYEEPIREYDLHGQRMLADKLDIPICGTEVAPGAMISAPEYITTRAVDIVRGDVSFKGGVGPLKKMAGLAESFGMNIEVHTNASTIIDAANLHVIASIANTTYFEQLVPEQLFTLGGVEKIHIDGEGFAHVPEGPGIGARIDWDMVEHNKVAEI